MNDNAIGAIIIWLFISCILAAIPAMIARNKDRSFGKWYLYGVLVGPIISIIHAMVIKKVKVCPACAERIRAEAKVCRYCGREA